MTAAGGILHKEYHDPDWARSGGRFHMAQLWVNLPAAHKMDPPRYQPLLASEMGRAELPGGAGTVTVIAGRYGEARGPATTFTPIELWDVTLAPSGVLSTALPAGHNAALFVVDGELTTGGTTASAQDLVVLDHDGETVEVRTGGGTRFLVLAGEPIDEPIVSYGPFVMNSEDEIRAAVVDFEAGRFGHLD